MNPVSSDSEKLLRYSKPGFDAELASGTSARAHYQKLLADVDEPGYFSEDASRSIARRELTARAIEHKIPFISRRSLGQKPVQQGFAKGAQHSQSFVKGHGKRPMRRF